VSRKSVVVEKDQLKHSDPVWGGAQTALNHLSEVVASGASRDAEKRNGFHILIANSHKNET
jgi:hypothetical protein